MSNIVECKSCKHQIDSTAKTCPSCGVEKPGIKAPTSGCLVVFIIVIAIGFFAEFTKEPLTPAEQRTKEISKQFNALYGDHLQLTQLIKSKMKNPDSFENIKTTYLDKGDYLIVETKYRGTNGFGGVVPNGVIAKVAMDGRILEILSE